MCTGLFVHLFCWLSRSGLPSPLAEHANFCLHNIQSPQNAAILRKKNVQQSFSQSHSKFGETAIIQCASNALLAVCWARVHKLSLWNMIDLNHVLDLEDNLFKY